MFGHSNLPSVHDLGGFGLIGKLGGLPRQYENDRKDQGIGGTGTGQPGASEDVKAEVEDHAVVKQ